MKDPKPDPRANWPEEGEVIQIGEFRREWFRLTGPRISEFIKIFREKGSGRYVIGGEKIGGIRLIALLHFKDGFVRFTTVIDGRPDYQPTVAQLAEPEFFKRLGVSLVTNPYRNAYAQEATLVIDETLSRGNRGPKKFKMRNIDEALVWLGMTDCAQLIEEAT